jgi:Fe-S cluster assembly protein SufD
VDTALLDEFGTGDAQARAESWRYSRQALRALEQTEFAAPDPNVELAPDLVARFDWPETRGHRVVFVNGGFSARYSSLASGVTLDTDNPQRLVDGAMLHFVLVGASGERAVRWQRRLSLQLDRGSAGLIEQHVGTGSVLGAVESMITLGNGARLDVTTLSDLPDDASLYRREQVSIGTNSAYRSTHALFGGRLQRFDLDVQMSDEQAAYESRGVVALRGRQHVDVHLNACHAARDTRSDVAWRGVADQRGRGILHGAITVAEGADGSDARLQTKNLLLSPHAEIDAQPVLEIYADEVKASHGATVGQLDERALFYLRSRGLPAALARKLLIAGFCREVLDRIGNEVLHERVEAALATRLPANTEAS